MEPLRRRHQPADRNGFVIAGEVAGALPSGHSVRVPARYRVRLGGRTFTVWDHDERSAVATANEWLDAGEKLGIDPHARSTVERIGDVPGPDDLLGTTQGTEVEGHATVVPKEPLRDRVLYSIVGFCRRLFRRSGGSAVEDRG